MVLIFAYILNIIDYLFTLYWVRLYGISAEANPIGRWLFQQNLAGFVKIIIVGGLFVLLGYLLKRRPKIKSVSYLILGVYGAVVAYHTLMVFLV